MGKAYDTQSAMSVGDPRLEQLLEVTCSLATATSEEEVARALTSDGISALGAAYGGMWLLDRDKAQLRLVGVSQLPRGTVDRWSMVSVDIDAPMPQAVRDNAPVFVDSLDDYRARFPESFERIRDTISSPEASYAMAPICDKGPPLGALVITYDKVGAASANATVLMILARQIAVALRRIESHAAEFAARLDAEEATRAREEILSVVSHDLRNPLGTILMGVTTLQQLVDPETTPKADRILVIAERIQRQSDRMARLIEDLVDFAGIQAGKLSIERRPTAPEKIIAATAELFGPLAQERNVGFKVDIAEKLPVIDVDPERGLQVFANLVTNALKVTSKGGQVTVGATDGDEVVFFVRDSGPGIDASELPRLFERYWRSKKATYKGAGLGLSIARGIVDAHHGRIWAESQVGVGATFFFTLTPRA